MKIFSKIYDFICVYEDLFIFCFFMFLLMVGCLKFAEYFDTKLTEEKSIILNTKDYVIFDKCSKFDNKFYCYNIEKD